MSILIKGMDMPTDCGHCRFFGKSWVEKDNSWCDLTENHITYVGEIAGFCPLVEIPTPHGRLIDWDAFNNKLDIQYAEGRGKALAPTILEEEK